jgi:hypothetical protein
VNLSSSPARVSFFRTPALRCSETDTGCLGIRPFAANRGVAGRALCQWLILASHEGECARTVWSLFMICLPRNALRNATNNRKLTVHFQKVRRSEMPRGSRAAVSSQSCQTCIHVFHLSSLCLALYVGTLAPAQNHFSPWHDTTLAGRMPAP